jgi:putative membrane protein
MNESNAKMPPETIRIHQANERTMLAWVRTGIALMAFGFAIARFGLFLRQIAAVSHMEHAPLLGSSAVGLALVTLGMFTNGYATLRYGTVRRAILRGDLGAPSATMVYALGAIAATVGLGMVALLARTFSE